MAIEDLLVIDYFERELKKYKYYAENLNNKGLQKIYSNKKMWLSRLLHIVKKLDKESKEELTLQEAIKYITDDDTAIDLVVKALEKQIPKKIINDANYGIVKATDLENGTVLTYSCYPCPNCRKWIHNNKSHKYCCYCGQALDWSDANDG